MFNPKRSKLMKNMPLLRPNAILIVFISISLAITTSYQGFTQEYKIKTIVLDAGHGGKDGSTRGAYSTEKDVALKTALRLGAAIEANMKDVKVIYTRSTDVFVPLYERIAIANNAKADLFISIHCNDMPMIRSSVVTGSRKGKNGKRIPITETVYRKSTSTRGVETFVSGMGRISEQDEVIKRENAAIFLEENYKENYEGFDPNNAENYIILSLMKNTFRTQSLKLAKLVQDEYVNVGRVNRGVQEKSLAVLARAGMPAILTEIGFISNPDEEDYMNSEAGQIEITNCLLKAIQSYQHRIEG
ncbi:N-acetylmuramoyl-L-alanine amidase [Pedobacter sp. PACM 27299]|uniref:N-acetylmuramoyl-L-alanine amidase family protein n=1 Tax=Pedobacter sp. PACM 27299 TaxID=1727164 RepID=UPI00070629FF|nr:N-acetylmuramoyl-L-alanine amidase [Pedobacter sp. PACM 27299]ALL05655.1 N-acetylmuramoyl-L-alanine amidase [Pedobacter sp. PACM 27299]